MSAVVLFDMSRKIDLTGKTFGRLTVLEQAAGRKWVCKCECGTVKEIFAQSLTKGVTKSCGCLQREIVAKQSDARRAHGFDVMALREYNGVQYVNWKGMTYRVCPHGDSAIVLYRCFASEPEECPLCEARGELEVCYEVNETLIPY